MILNKIKVKLPTSAIVSLEDNFLLGEYLKGVSYYFASC